jgi:hypothetical protein
MKNILFTFIGTLLALQIQAQIKGTVLNAVDKKPIPYVNIWIENDNIGTTADEGGKFVLPTPKDNQSLIFNALGYENKTILASEIDGLVYLVPKVFELNEVLVVSPKNIKELKLGEFRSEAIIGSINSGWGNNPSVLAKYFAFDSTYQSTPYLKKIEIHTVSDLKKSKFNIRIYSRGEDGKPNEELCKENILGIASKGNSITIIDLSKFNIVFPKRGLFIATEVLAINENRFDFKFVPDITKPKINENRFSYEPSFRAIKGEKNESTWIYKQGKWTEFSKNFAENHRFKNGLLAMELTLTN